MEIVNFTEARKDLSKLMQQVTDDHVAIAITRQKGKPVVMIALDDYNSWQKTTYVTRTKANKRRLDDALENIAKGNVIVKNQEELTTLVKEAYAKQGLNYNDE